ncbi:hypothetical protein KIN20_032989 [Parelaphostrongylus tenuis]|uniref:Uncharacterized protein n=1 Tax=Parelaphostrongylus tenuis TaxID=148309 RepID=A0AAD5WIW3_PARTN|nr:hypothetical protein KIN20_032989 [Parelaphostrongylus tenuis]
MMENERKCIIVENTVTGLCTGLMGLGAAMPCMPNQMVAVTPVADHYTSISGSLSTTNVIMANWTRMMWQSVLSRAVRMLASGPFASHFVSATGTVGGN